MGFSNGNRQPMYNRIFHQQIRWRQNESNENLVTNTAVSRLKSSTKQTWTTDANHLKMPNYRQNTWTKKNNFFVSNQSL